MDRRSSPLRFAALLVLLGGALGALALLRGLFDPDYFWHFTTGELILDTGTIPRTDRFSFTWTGRPWIPDQWLAEVAIAAIQRWFGPAVLLVAFGVVAALGPALIVAEHARTHSWTPGAILVGALAIAALMPQVTARPQVISFAFMGLTMALLMSARPDTTRRLWLLPPVFALWANTHGFFVLGLGVGFAYLVATLLGRTPMASRLGLTLVIGLATILATALTPSGPEGLLYAASFGDPSDLGAQRISEWQSPDFHNAQFLPFLVILGVFMLGGTRGTAGWKVAVALMGAGIGLYASRAIGVGTVMMMPLLLEQAVRHPRSPQPGPRGAAAAELLAAATIAAVLIGGTVVRGTVSADDRRVPVQATALLAAEAPGARVLAAYEWGGYVISELSRSGGSVFVDGRMHKYAPDVLEDYVAIVSGEPGWSELIAQYGVEYILLQPHQPLVKGAAQRAGWCEAFRNANQVLLKPCEAFDR